MAVTIYRASLQPVAIIVGGAAGLRPSLHSNTSAIYATNVLIMPLNQILFHCRTVAIRRIGCKTARHSRAVFPLSCSHCSVLPQFFLSAQHKSSRLLEWSETQTKILRLHQASDFILDNCSSWLTNLCCLVSWQWSHELYSGNDTNEASWQKEKGFLAEQVFIPFMKFWGRSKISVYALLFLWM